MRVGATTLARQPSVGKSVVRVDLLNLPAHCNQRISSHFSDSSDFLAWLDLIWSGITTKNTDAEPLMLNCRGQENVMEEEVTDDVPQWVSKERNFYRTLLWKRDRNTVRKEAAARHHDACCLDRKPARKGWVFCHRQESPPSFQPGLEILWNLSLVPGTSQLQGPPLVFKNGVNHHWKTERLETDGDCFYRTLFSVLSLLVWGVQFCHFR